MLHNLFHSREKRVYGLFPSSNSETVNTLFDRMWREWDSQCKPELKKPSNIDIWLDNFILAWNQNFCIGLLVFGSDDVDPVITIGFLGDF